MQDEQQRSRAKVKVAANIATSSTYTISCLPSSPTYHFSPRYPKYLTHTIQSNQKLNHDKRGDRDVRYRDHRTTVHPVPSVPSRVSRLISNTLPQELLRGMIPLVGANPASI
jgi:hypothetical protein